MLVTDLVAQAHGDETWNLTRDDVMANWDADVDWFAWWEGSFLFADGGVIDLGIIRDSTLNAQNRLQTFYESWEMAARIGGYQAMRVMSSLCAGGLSQIPKDVARCSPIGVVIAARVLSWRPRRGEGRCVVASSPTLPITPPV
jgi:hypothetical protein